MTKKRSKCLFVVFSILLVICLIASFVNFTYPFTINGNYYSYSNFVSNLKLGEDIGKTYRIVYRADLPEGEAQANYDDLRTSTKDELKKILQSEGYSDVTASKYGSDSILIQVGNILTIDDENEIVDLIGAPATISFSVNSDNSDPFAGAKDIEEVYATSYYDQETADNVYVVVIDFNDEVTDSIADATADGGTVYIFFGDTEFTQMDLGSSAISEGVIYMQSESFQSLALANTVANRIKTGMLDLELTTVESGTISPTYGVGANLWIAVAMAIFILIGFIFLIVKYRHLGWLACFNLLFFITISLFLLQSIPLVHLNFSGMIGFLIAFIFIVDSFISIFEKAKEHYNYNTKLYIAMKVAQSETLTKTFVMNVGLMIVGFISLLMPSLAIQSFGWVVFVMSFVSLFCIQLLNRLFIKMYLPFNSTDGKKCNFHKGGQNA